MEVIGTDREANREIDREGRRKDRQKEREREREREERKRKWEWRTPVKETATGFQSRARVACLA